MQVTIMGKRYEFRYTNEMDDDDTDGQCDPPMMPGKAIEVRRSLIGVRRLEVEIHEMMHAADWAKDEEWVELFARDISAVLWRIGYRITD